MKKKNIIDIFRKENEYNINNMLKDLDPIDIRLSKLKHYMIDIIKYLYINNIPLDKHVCNIDDVYTKDSHLVFRVTDDLHLIIKIQYIKGYIDTARITMYNNMDVDSILGFHNINLTQKHYTSTDLVLIEDMLKEVCSELSKDNELYTWYFLQGVKLEEVFLL